MKRDLEGKFALPGGEVVLRASLDGDRLSVTAGDGPARVFSARVANGEVTLRAEDGRVVRAFVSGESVSIDGRTVRVTRVEAGKKRGARSADETALEAPMPGTCRDVFVVAGARVEKGQRLVLVEAMKMEHEIKAPRAGTVKAVRVKKGEAVAPGSLLVEMDA